MAHRAPQHVLPEGLGALHQGAPVTGLLVCVGWVVFTTIVLIVIELNLTSKDYRR